VNTYKLLVFLAALGVLLLLMQGCSQEQPTPSESIAAAADDTPLEHAKKHLDPKYVCPMHPQIVRDDEGSCPICGMDLVAKQVEPPAETALEHARKHLDPKFVCPMHPQIVRDDEGTCPICGMDLVEKMIDAGEGRQPTVQISSAVINSMGVRTDVARNTTLWKTIETVGRIDYDETRMAHVHPRASGWMETLNLRAEGDPIARGQLIGRFYSEEILSAQVDFLIALDQPGGNAKVDQARNRLRLLGVPEFTISAIQNKRESVNTVPVISNADGVVTMLGARQGMYVTPDREIVTIADLSRIWVIVDIYEHQIDWLAEGVSAKIRVPAYPGRAWEGQVEYIYPALDPQSRTLQVRLAFDNPDGLLKANMFADVVIYGGPRRDTLAVPAEALIETGKRRAVVRALGNGRFRPVDVVTGMRADGMVEIFSGLKAGDEVVVSGQFLIDSEASLQASFMRMDDAPPPAERATTAHSGH
jgi:Cu(I)/Ag(I) efflux system membrane fusion protein